jgi:hypothetical protein
MTTTLPAIEWASSLTAEALAQRLTIAATEPRSYSAPERNALMQEAARRIMTARITNPADVHRLVVGCWTKFLRAEKFDDGTIGQAEAYLEAAHIGLSALGCNVPPAPFGLYLLVQAALRDAGPVPSATSPVALAAWRERVTDSIMKEITS